MDKQPEQKTGEFLGMPYDWRSPTPERLAEEERASDHRIFIPKRFGWGYTINFSELSRRLGFKHK